MRWQLVIAVVVVLFDLLGVAWTIDGARHVTGVCFDAAPASASGCHETGSRIDWGLGETLWIAVALTSVLSLALFLSRDAKRWLAVALVGALAIAAPAAVALADSAFNDSGRYRLL